MSASTCADDKCGTCQNHPAVTAEDGRVPGSARVLARVWLEPLRCLSSPAAFPCAHDHHLPSRPPTLAPYLLPLNSVSFSSLPSFAPSSSSGNTLTCKQTCNSHVSGFPRRFPSMI
ncbi:hypothetical protein BC628DRAFT_246538 [Trametes gibbosa]|nr:hypothetical protein BC628DRAFT_246538 [Trametes gibbosa]